MVGEESLGRTLDANTTEMVMAGCMTHRLDVEFEVFWWSVNPAFEKGRKRTYVGGQDV